MAYYVSVFVTITKDILESNFTAAHYCVFKNIGISFMPSQLCNDLMETF